MSLPLVSPLALYCSLFLILCSLFYTLSSTLQLCFLTSTLYALNSSSLLLLFVLLYSPFHCLSPLFSPHLSLPNILLHHTRIPFHSPISHTHTHTHTHHTHHHSSSFSFTPVYSQSSSLYITSNLPSIIS